MWNSILIDAGGYARERLLRPAIAALWVLLLAMLLLAEPGWAGARLMAAGFFLAAAVAVLRVWDDLADLAHDRLAHPGRLLVSSRHQRAFSVFVMIGLAALAACTFQNVPRLVIYCALVAGLAGLYHTRRGRGCPRPVRTALVLVKYPVLLVVAGIGSSGRAWLLALVLYLILLSYEWVSDAELRTVSMSEYMLSGAAGLLLTSVVFVTTGARP